MRLDPYLRELRRILPETWDVALEAVALGGGRPDAVLRVSAPEGSRRTLSVQAKRKVSGRDAVQLASAKDTVIVFAEYLSEMAQKRLREAGVSYLDLTGNVWVCIDRPAVFIERRGAARDPTPVPTAVRSLKGAKAARIVRGLCDWRPPQGVREIARRTGTDPSYVTRVLSLLEEEDIVRRNDWGEVEDVRWRELLERWARDYAVGRSNQTIPCLAPRGVEYVKTRLRDLDGGYAVTGLFGVPAESQILPGRVLSCYVRNSDQAIAELDATPTDAGANLLLLEPFDDVVFERTRSEAGLTVVAPSQCTVDLLTGPGREPAQGDALIQWMEENEDAWRA